jgi:hypothetical protein
MDYAKTGLTEGFLVFFELGRGYECEECVCPVAEKDGPRFQNGPVLALVKSGWPGVGWVVGIEPRLRTGQMDWSGRGIC